LRFTWANETVQADPSENHGEPPMPQTVHACPLPPASQLHAHRAPGDFLDCYRIASDMSARAAAEVITAFPGWAKALLRLRNAAVTPFGLKHGAAEDVDRIAVFPLQSETGAEVIVGLDDRHLDFRVAVLQQEGWVYLSTWVQPHNLGGRVYLAGVMPFHIAIVRNALARVGRMRRVA